MHVLYPPMASPRTRVGTASDKPAPMAGNAPAIPPPMPKKRRYRGTAPRNAPMRAMHSAKKRFPATMYRSRFPVRSARCPTGMRIAALAEGGGGGGHARPAPQDPRRDDGRGEEKRRPETPVRDRAAQSRPGRHPEIEGGRIPTVRPPQKMGRGYGAHVRHHGRGEAGQADPGEERDPAHPP